MAIVSAQNLTMEFDGKVLFSGINFEVKPGEHAGLIGANGTGKTTLFKLITGELEPTNGDIITARGTKIGYLEQHACAGSSLCVLDETMSIFSELMDIEVELEEIAAKIDSGDGDQSALIEHQQKLIEFFQNNGGLTFRNRTRSALIGLGFKEHDLYLPCEKLSGGQRSKVAMCKLLLSGADLLLLDEPTNHLDISGTEWLEGYIQGYKGTILVISHDRYFLDKICNKTIEITNKTAYLSKGNYTDYLKTKQERIEVERLHYEKQLEEINKLSEFVQRAEQASASNHSLKSMGIERAKWLKKKKAELIIPEQELSKVRISFTTECETGKDVLTVTGLSKSFGDTDLFTDVNMNVYKKDRVFILGPNGCGKTTFLRILTNQIVADHGSYSFGANVKLGYFDQSLENLTGGKTVLDEIWDDHCSFPETKVRNYLALFLFRGEDVFKNVDTLSGGEKAKLCFLKLMLSGANLLLLDEPTNHLDIPSREVLEDAIAEYKGTVIAVSHDRYFINKLATRICMMTNEGLKNTIGGYDDYISNLNSEVAKASPKVEPKVNDYKLRKERQSEINRLRGKIKRTEAEIDEFDAKISEINELLSTPEVSADFQKIMELTEEINNLSTKQDELMHNWEEFNERLCKLTEE
ncbi:MAG: ABC-F family ATP-binding cassette domain-containing protein [Clostridia bacterium]|nr:ABC-F family ATP-binding cassette domain-containing protein [Clostridia bacterium]